MSVPQPYSPVQMWERPDWSARDYWTQAPQIIPPSPPFELWVPAAEQLGFAESPREMSYFQSLTYPYTNPPVPPAAPPVTVTTPQHNVRADWTLRDYSSNQDRFSAFALPKLPPLVGINVPQQNARPDWTLEQYNANQDRFSALLGSIASGVVPCPEGFAFGELPRDLTALRLAANVYFPHAFGAASNPPVFSIPASYAIAPRDMTAEKLVIDQMKATYLAIPIVPASDGFSSFDYEPTDMVPYEWVVRSVAIAANPPPQIPPSSIPYIEPRDWPQLPYQQVNYQDLADRFTATRVAPHGAFFPPGLVPTFTLEALIRDIPRATPDPNVKSLPPPPPRVVPSPATILERPDWTSSQYQSYQDAFSAWVNAIPPAPGFLVTAVTAGEYNGVYHWPGDVFMLNRALDFSDSTVNYQARANETAYGWMARAPAGSNVFTTVVSQQIPFVPAVDPSRRFVM